MASQTGTMQQAGVSKQLKYNLQSKDYHLQELNFPDFIAEH